MNLIIDSISFLFYWTVVVFSYTLLLFPGPFTPLVLSLIFLRKRLKIRCCLSISALLSLILFLVCIVYPYYFQGYKEYDHSYFPSEGFGIHQNDFADAFAYIYTSYGHGFLWLLVGLLATVHGRIFSQPIREAIWKSTMVTAYAYLLFKFETISEPMSYILE